MRRTCISECAPECTTYDFGLREWALSKHTSECPSQLDGQQAGVVRSAKVSHPAGVGQGTTLSFPIVPLQHQDSHLLSVPRLSFIMRGNCTRFSKLKRRQRSKRSFRQRSPERVQRFLILLSTQIACSDDHILVLCENGEGRQPHLSKIKALTLTKLFWTTCKCMRVLR